MGASGTTVIDFGAFPGASDASVAVTGQAGILAGSLVEAWIFPLATTDHGADEHLVETIAVHADPSSIIAGTGFTIRAYNSSQLDEPVPPQPGNGGGVQDRQSGNNRSGGGTGTRLYGKWTVAWVWN